MRLDLLYRCSPATNIPGGTLTMVSKSNGRVLFKATSLRKSSRDMAAVAIWPRLEASATISEATLRAFCLSMQAVHTLR